LGYEGGSEGELHAIRENWDVAFYRIRSDWLAMVMTRWHLWPEGRILYVRFLGRPLNAEAQQRVRHWSWDIDEVPQR
jgi:hypothetical protein